MKNTSFKHLNSIITPDKVKLHKFIFSIILILIFSIIYTFFDNDEFAGRIYNNTDFNGKILPSNSYIVNDYFDRLYYSVVIQTTLGLGDIFPSNRSLRLLTMLQAMSTIFLILI